LGVEATTSTAFGIDRRWHGAGLEQCPNGGDGCDRGCPQLWSQLHRLSLVGLGVIDEALGHSLSGHVLQTEGLGADLQLVIVELAPMAALVFHGVKLPVGFFNQVRLANQAIAIALEPDGPHLPGFLAVVATQGMNPVMQASAFQGVLVVDKFPSTKHAPAAVRTVGVLVEGGDGNVVDFMHRE